MRSPVDVVRLDDRSAAVVVHRLRLTMRPFDVRVLAGDVLQHLPVGRLDEAVVVEARVGGERAEQTDVRPFRRLDGADAPVVGVVHVANVETGALAGESAGAQRGETALVRELRQRVRLVHELRQLRAPEELAHRGDHRADVDERAGRGLALVEDRHALLDDALHAEQADAELVHDEFAHRPDAPVAQVVDVVRVGHTVVDADHHPDHLDDVVLGERPALLGHVLAGAAVHLVAPDAAEVVAARVEEEVVQQRARALCAGRLARAEPAVDLHQRLRLVLHPRVAFQRGADVRVLRIVVNVGEQFEQFRVLREADGAQERCHGQLALPVDLH